MVFCLSFSALLATSISGQTNDEDEDIFELSPFEVTTDDAIGYEAQNTLSGTRLRSSVKDVGTTLTIITEQFMEDLALNNTNELIEFTPGAEKETTQNGTGTGGDVSLYWGDNTRFRGQHAENIYRNQFKTNMPSDGYNAGRFEFTRGANSILFGIGDPTGAVNRYTNDALWWDLNRWRVQLNNHGQLRNELKWNKVLKENELAIMFAALIDQDEIWIEPNFQDQERLYGALHWRPNSKWTVKIRGEIMDWDRSAVDWSLTQDAVTPFLDAAAAAGNTPEEHAIPHNMWIWNSPGTYAPEFRAWNLTGTFPGTTNFVFDGSPDRGFDSAENLMNMPVGEKRQVLGVNVVSLPVGFLPRDWQPSGHSQIQHFDGYNFQGVVSYTANEYFSVEYAYNKENMNYDFYANWGTTQIGIDAASTLIDNSTPNPNVGKYFIYNNTNWAMLQNRDLQNHRITTSLNYDFDKETENLGWLGNHTIAGLFELEDSISLWDSTRLINTTPLPGYEFPTTAGGYANEYPQGIIFSGWGTPNSINYMNYVDPATRTTYGPTDPREIRETVNKIDGIQAEWVHTYVNPTQVRAFESKLQSTLLVLQSRWWKDRIVTTLGWRRDGRKEYDAMDPNQNQTIEQVWQSPTGFGGEATPAKEMKRFLSKDDDPDTLTRGVVYHVHQGSGTFSYFGLNYNYSTSFGLASFNNTPAGDPSPDKTGETEDFGFRVGLWDNKLNAQFTVFESSVLNEPILDPINYGNLGVLMNFIGQPDLQFISHVRDRNDLTSKGWEFTLTANPARNWRVSASIDHYKTTKTNIAPVTGQMIEQYRSEWLADPTAEVGTATGSKTVQQTFDELWLTYQQAVSQEGSRSMNERRYKITLVSSYDFDEGPLKGWGFGGDLIWKDKASTGYALKLLDQGAWVLDPNQPFFTGDITHLGAHLRYKTKLFKDRVDATFQLNVRNIGGVDPYVVRAAADVSAPNTPVPQVINRGEPTTYVFSAMFDF